MTNPKNDKEHTIAASIEIRRQLEELLAQISHGVDMLRTEVQQKQNRRA
jgi:hypothetical protein